MNTFLNNSLLVIIGSLLGKAAGFGRDLYIANNYGASAISDAFWVAFLIPMLLISLTEYIFNVPFVKVLTSQFQATKEEGWKAASAISQILLIFAVLSTIVSMALSPLLVSIFAPGLDENSARLSEKMMLIISPSITLFMLTGIIRGILLSHHDFFAQSFNLFIFNCVFLLTLFLSNFADKENLLAWAVLAGAAIQFLWLTPFFLRLSPKIYSLKNSYKNSGLKEFSSLMSIIVLGGVISRLGEVINRAMASNLPEGSITALYYGLRLSEIPIMIIVSPLMLVFFPKLVVFYENNTQSELKRTAKICMAAIITTTTVSTIFFILFSEDIVNTLYGRGMFNHNDVVMTSEALIFYAPGIIAFGIYAFLSQICYATGKGKMVIYSALLGTLTNIAFNFLLIGSMAHMGLSLATSLSYFAMAAFLMFSTKDEFLRILSSN